MTQRFTLDSLGHDPMTNSNNPLELRAACPLADAASVHSVLGMAVDGANDRAAADDALMIWDCLFDAVTERLRDTVSAAFAARHGSGSQDAATQIRVAVLECVEALNQLHEGLTVERAASRQQELALRLAQRSAIEAQLQLAVTHATGMSVRAQAYGVADYLQSDVR